MFDFRGLNNLTAETVRESGTITTKTNRGNTTGADIVVSVGRSGDADRAAFSGAVFPHPGGVSLTFTVASPSTTFFVFFLVVEFVVALLSDGRALSTFVFLAVFAARRHAVGTHVIFVLVAFTVLLPSFASDTGTNSVRDTLFFGIFLGRAFTTTKGVFTSADRAARSWAVGKHPVGVFDTLTSTGPGNTEGFDITAFTSVLNAEFGDFLAGSCTSGSFSEDTESVSFAFEIFGNSVSALFVFGLAFVTAEFFVLANFALAAVTV